MPRLPYGLKTTENGRNQEHTNLDAIQHQHWESEHSWYFQLVGQKHTICIKSIVISCTNSNDEVMSLAQTNLPTWIDEIGKNQDK